MKWLITPQGDQWLSLITQRRFRFKVRRQMRMQTRHKRFHFACLGSFQRLDNIQSELCYSIYYIFIYSMLLIFMVHNTLCWYAVDVIPVVTCLCYLVLNLSDRFWFYRWHEQRFLHISAWHIFHFSLCFTAAEPVRTTQLKQSCFLIRWLLALSSFLPRTQLTLYGIIFRQEIIRASPLIKAVNSKCQLHPFHSPPEFMSGGGAVRQGKISSLWRNGKVARSLVRCISFPVLSMMSACKLAPH